MATKKTTETEVISEKEKELEKALEEMREENRALLKEAEALRKASQKPKSPVKKDAYDADYWNEKVEYEAFYDGNEYADDISVMVNGKRFLIQRGKKVMIPRYVVHVLENQAKQKKYSAEYNRGLHDEFERETRKLLGE